MPNPYLHNDRAARFVDGLASREMEEALVHRLYTVATRERVVKGIMRDAAYYPHQPRKDKSGQVIMRKVEIKVQSGRDSEDGGLDGEAAEGDDGDEDTFYYYHDYNEGVPVRTQAQLDDYSEKVQADLRRRAEAREELYRQVVEGELGPRTVRGYNRAFSAFSTKQEQQEHLQEVYYKRMEQRQRVRDQAAAKATNRTKYEMLLLPYRCRRFLPRDTYKTNKRRLLSADGKPRSPGLRSPSPNAKSDSEGGADGENRLLRYAIARREYEAERERHWNPLGAPLLSHHYFKADGQNTLNSLQPATPSARQLTRDCMPHISSRYRDYIHDGRDKARGRSGGSNSQIPNLNQGTGKVTIVK